MYAADGNDPWDNNNNNDAWQNNNNVDDAWENNDDDGENNNNNNNNDNSENNNQPKKNRGRQKLPMQKIENESNLQVTFSKRRAGIMKKTNELGLLCGAEAAVVLFSPGNKAHSYGHPDVESVANRFLNTNAPQERPDPFRAAHNRATMHHRCQELARVEAQLEQERKRKKDLEQVRKNYQRQNLFPRPLDELNHEELTQLQSSILRFKNDLETKMKSVVGSASLGVQDQGGSVQRAHPVGPNNQLPRNDYGSTDNFGLNAGAGNYPNPTNPMAGGSSSNQFLDPNAGAMNQSYPGHMGGAGTSSQLFPGGPSTSSNVVVPYNYGYYGGDAGASTSRNVNGDDDGEEEEGDYQNQFQGFDGNYGGEGF